MVTYIAASLAKSLAIDDSLDTGSPASLAAAAKDAGEPVSRLSSMAKLFASEAAMYVTTEAVQVFGGYGYVKEYPVERLFRDAKVTEIYEGTSEIQRTIIARELYR